MGEHEVHLWRLFPLLQQVIVRVGVHRTEIGAELGLTNSQLAVLGAVYGNDDRTMSEVAEESLISPPAATRIAAGLVGKGLIERVTDGKDRRVVRLRITQRGREAFDQVHQEASALLARILAKMSEDEQVALLGGLTSFIDAVMAVEAEEDKA